MMKRVCIALMSLSGIAAANAPVPLPSTPSLGIAEGRCRANEPGPAFLVAVAGLKDRAGRLKLEVYPSNDQDFLADDNVLINAGKTFRRAETNVPPQGNVEMCIRVPAAGAYSLSLLHDRDANRKFGLSIDGIGFAGNPKLGLSKPKSAATRAVAGPGVTAISIRMNYRKGLFSFGPLGN
jgi:uncharacterized protein (DUF2141 family)